MDAARMNEFEEALKGIDPCEVTPDDETRIDSMAAFGAMFIAHALVYDGVIAEGDLYQLVDQIINRTYRESWTNADH